MVPDDSLSINNGALAPHGPEKNSWIFKQFETIAQRYEFNLTDPYKSIPKEAKQLIMYGGNDKFAVESKTLGITRNYKIDFEGVANFIENQYKTADSTSLKRWAKDYMDKVECDDCNGSRLRKESLFFKINNQNIADLAHKDIVEIPSYKVLNRLSQPAHTLIITAPFSA